MVTRQTRALTDVPFPHVTEHVDQSFHSLNETSEEQKSKLINYHYNVRKSVKRVLIYFITFRAINPLQNTKLLFYLNT